MRLHFQPKLIYNCIIQIKRQFEQRTSQLFTGFLLFFCLFICKTKSTLHRLIHIWDTRHTHTCHIPNSVFLYSHDSINSLNEVTYGVHSLPYPIPPGTTTNIIITIIITMRRHLPIIQLRAGPFISGWFC